MKIKDYKLIIVKNLKALFLKNKKSHVSMLIHDSVVLDLAEADMQELKKIVDIFSDTRYGKYKVGVSAGKSFGNMRRVR